MGRPLTPKEMRDITLEFYSQFCRADLSKIEPGVHILCDPERDAVLKGLGRAYTIYLLAREDVCVLCASPRYREVLEQWRGLDRRTVIQRARERFPLRRLRLMVLEEERVTRFDGIRVLRAEDYPLYEAFFRAIRPNAHPEDWLEEYFLEKTGLGYFTGYEVARQLVSVCDPPDMPYLEGRIQHTGIQTQREFRRKGYGLRAAGLAAHHLRELGVCPQWECDAENRPSFQLAKAIGYRHYADAYVLEE